MEERNRTRMFLLVFVLLCATCCLPATNGTTSLVDTILESIELALSFYARNYKEVNIDGIFGLRMVEGTTLFYSYL
jgi:hypothetical protein